MVINCAVNVKENVTLSLTKSSKSISRNLMVDNKKIKLLSKNVFNITDVTEKDDAIYDCTVCGQQRERRIILSISKRGNSKT